MVVVVDLCFEAIPKRVKVYHRLVRGVVRLRSQLEAANIKDCQSSCRTPTWTTSTAWSS
jgi:hypothetical protein